MEDLNDILSFYKGIESFKTNLTEGTSKLVLSPRLLSRINASIDRLEDEKKGFHYLSSQEKVTIYELDTILKTAVNFKLAQRCAASFDGSIHLGRLKSASRLELNAIYLDKVLGLDAIANIISLECIKCLNIPKLLEVGISDNLRTVSIKFCNLRQINPGDFESIKNITHLDLSFNQLVNVGGLNCFLALKCLNLSYNCLENLPVLNSTCSSTLVDFRISNNNLTDLSGIERLVNLENLDVSDNCIYDKVVLKPLIFLHYLKRLNFINCPISLKKFYRMYVVHFLDLNGPLNEFFLDETPLSEVEKDFLGSFKANRTQYQDLSSPNVSLPPQPEITPIPEAGIKKSPKARRKSKVRDVVIMDSTSPPLSTSSGLKNGSKKKSITKKKSSQDLIQDLSINSESEDVISRRLMEVVHEDDFCEVKDSRVVASVHATEEDYPVKEGDGIPPLETEEPTEINSDLKTEGPPPEIDNPPIENHEFETATDPPEESQNSAPDDDTLVYEESGKIDCEPNDPTDLETEAVNSNNVESEASANPVSSSDESEYNSVDENLWPVKKIVDSNKTVDIFLVLLDTEIKERSTISGRTTARFPIEFIQSCDQISDSPITIKIQLMTLLKVKSSSVYIMEFSDSQILLKKMAEVLKSRSLHSGISSNGGQLDYEDPSKNIEEIVPDISMVSEPTKVNEQSEAGLAEGGEEMFDEETNSFERSFDGTNSSSVTSCVTSPLTGNIEGSSIQNPINKYSQFSSTGSENSKTPETPQRRESDVVVISEPSESSVEVIDEDKKEEEASVSSIDNTLESTETPKLLSQSASSESESLVTTYDTFVGHLPTGGAPSKESNESHSEESNAQYSHEDNNNEDLSFEYSNRINDLNDCEDKSKESTFDTVEGVRIEGMDSADKTDEFKSSTPIEGSSTPMTRSFEDSSNRLSCEVSTSEEDSNHQESGERNLSTDDLQSSSNYKTADFDNSESSNDLVAKQISDDDENYNFTDFTEIDHRVKIFLYQHVFEDDFEQPLLFIRCHMWKTGGAEYPANIIFSTLKIYFFLEKGSLKGLDASDYLVLQECHSVKSVKQIFTLIWHQGLGIQLNSFSYFILLHTKEYSENLFSAIKGLSLKGCEMVVKPNSKLELNLQQVVLTSHLVNDVVDPTIVVYSICYDVLIIKDNDVDETLKLSGLVVTCGEFYLLLGDLNWLCNTKDLPNIHLHQKMSRLIDMETKGLRLDLHFLDEEEAVEEVWSLKCLNRGHIDSIVKSIPNQFTSVDPI